MDLKLLLVCCALGLGTFIIKGTQLRWHWVNFSAINVVFFGLQQKNWFFIIPWIFVLVVNTGLLILEYKMKRPEQMHQPANHATIDP